MTPSATNFLTKLRIFKFNPNSAGSFLRQEKPNHKGDNLSHDTKKPFCSAGAWFSEQTPPQSQIGSAEVPFSERLKPKNTNGSAETTLTEPNQNHLRNHLRGGDAEMDGMIISDQAPQNRLYQTRPSPDRPYCQPDSTRDR